MSAAAVRRALVSVSDKAGLDAFVRGLVELGFEILSTGGTRRFLEEAGIDVLDISSYTGFPEIMDGRVKTLHPKVHGAILGRPDLPGDAEAIAAHEIVPFELVVCNLYPFQQTIARDGVTIEEAIEQIDIGGPSMVRSAAKNHAYVGIVTRPDQYADVLQALADGTLSDHHRRALAAAAFEMTAQYDRAIADYLAALPQPESQDRAAAEPEDAPFPETLQLSFQKKAGLRYGENPHQQAAFYAERTPPGGSLASAKQLHGKELSYNNLLDLDAALVLALEFRQPAAAVLKHNNPCGCGIGQTLCEAFDRAYEGDPVSAFGSIISFNRVLDVPTAERLCEPGRFVEAIIAPGFEAAAFELLTTRPSWKKNVRLMECPAAEADMACGLDYRRVTGGLLVQDRDADAEDESQWQVVTERAPSDRELVDLRFAWSVCKHVKSNAIVYARDGMVTGVGAGQMSRLDSARIAAEKSAGRCQDGVCASDAFFPFRDGVDAASDAGILAIIQPGGSKRDDEVIAACDERGIAMVFTGRRHFKH